MALVAVEVIPYALPFREPYVTARGTLTQREMVLLRLRDEEGLVGLGEAVPLSLRGGVGVEAVVGELQALVESGWLHQAVDLASAFGGDAGVAGSLDVGAGLSAPARCAVQTALADLRARGAAASGDPGAGAWLSFVPHSDTNDNRTQEGATPVTCNATLVAGEPAAVAAEAERWAADGFSTFKLKLGTGEDVAQVRVVREAVGSAARIRIDVNGAWGLEEAKRTLAALEPWGVELAEQPVVTLEEMAALAASTSIPLAADESVESVADAERALAADACACTGVKLSKVGGPEEALAIAARLPTYVSSALDGPVGIAASARVAQAVDSARLLGPDREESGSSAAEPSAEGSPGGAMTASPDLAHGLATQRLFASTIAAVECELRSDRLLLPPGPGLGVEIDEEALTAHRL